MNIKNKISTVVLASLFAVMPLAASANTLNVSGSTGIVISPSGIVRVIGADVTAVGTNVIDAVLNIGSNVINVVLNTSGNTKVVANGTKTATTTDVKVGDTVSFKGTLSSSTGSTLTVTATKVRDTTSSPFPRFVFGTVSSVNTTNGSFVVANGNSTTTVFTNALTTIELNGSSATLATLPLNAKVLVTGSQNSDSSVTAAKVTAGTPQIKSGGDNSKDNDNDADDGNASSSGKVNAGGIRFGLNLLGGLHLGKGK